MTTIIPHMLASVDKSLISLASDGFNITYDGPIAIVSKEFEVPQGISKESTGAITADVRDAFSILKEVKGTKEPHVLVREKARARIENGKPTGYIVEMTSGGPIVYSMKELDRVPLLIGYGSLMDPEQLAANTADGDLRNATDSEVRKRLAQEKGVAEKIAYISIDGFSLGFTRAPTAKRYGATQAERNMWAVLNVRQYKNEKMCAALFDPEKLTGDPLSYLARENADEMEYARRVVDPEAISPLGGASMNLDKKIWMLDSPLITDVDGRLQTITVTIASKISDRYIDMVTNGLAGAEKVSRGFADKYVKNTRMPYGDPLSSDKKFMKVLEAKLR